MQAIVVESPGNIRMVETAKPRVGPGDVLTRVAWSGICGTDLAIMSGDMSLVREGLITYPVRIGHEWSGVVEQVGKDVKRFRPGDRVVSDTAVTCGTCAHCLRGDIAECRERRSLGTINHWPGSFAEYMLMPERHMHALPDSIDLDEAALIEPATIALAGVRKLVVSPATCVLIVGTGPIGLAALALVKSQGAGMVLVSGRKDRKLAVGRAMGADAVVNVTKEDLAGFVMKHTGGKGVDAVLETSGNIEALGPCVKVLAQGGTIALIGFFETSLNGFNIDAVVFKEVQLRGVMGEFGLVEPVIDAMGGRKMSLKPLITHRVPFAQAIEAMKTAHEKNETKIKMLVEMPRA
ncbi:MAG: zinc-dependent alcohol dehydrogenase [Spirochaetia bacterium]